MAIDRILNIDVWISQWQVILIPKALEDLSIFVIKQIHREEANFRKAKESYWIQMLRSLAPEGLNLDP